jgi:hypothetical protein
MLFLSIAGFVGGLFVPYFWEWEWVPRPVALIISVLYGAASLAVCALVVGRLARRSR